MLAEIIAIGDELTSGQRLDTNSQWLSQELSRIGTTVVWHTSVGDDLAAIIAVLKIAFSRADCLVLTGGLGPTADDLTRRAVAEAIGTDLQIDSRQLGRIEHIFQCRGREMPQRNRSQAELPIGSQAIDNPHGSAPGIDLVHQLNDDRETRLFALPGVPAEMKEMFRDSVEPAVRTMLGDNANTISHYCLKCFGVGESDLEAMLPDLIRRGRDPQVGITVSQATITLRVTAAGRSEEECREKMHSTIEVIHDSLGSLVFGEHDDELQQVVIRQLRERGVTLAIMEAGSGGLLSQWLHEADPSGETYLGGLVMRDPHAATQASLPAADFADADSQQSLAAAMARYGRDFFSADICLALGGYPADVDRADSPRYVGMALDSKTDMISQAKNFAGHPDVRGPRAAKQVLDMLRHHLLSAGEY